MEIELTLENLKTIKLWHFLVMKDREATLEDNQTITKIKAFTIIELLVVVAIIAIISGKVQNFIPFVKLDSIFTCSHPSNYFPI